MNYSELHKFVGNDGVDGFFIFYTALLNGMDVQRMPGQLFLINNYKAPEAKTSFVHSVAQSTRLSTTTFVLQKRFRRVLFQQAKVPMAKAATFSFFSSKDPIKYVNKIGYPVVVKEMFGENPSYAIYDIKNKEELFSAIDKVRKHLPVNSTRSPSSYAQTINLGSAESVDDNTRVKSSKSRFSIEKQLKGEVFRVYVIGGKVECVIKILKQGIAKVVAPHEKLKKLAEVAVEAIPGIKNAAVDIIHTDGDNFYLVEFSERLLLPCKITSQDDFSVMLNIYQKTIASEVLAAGGVLSSKKEKASYSLRFSGLTNLDSFIENSSREFEKFSMAFKVASRNDVLGELIISVSGMALVLAAILEKLFENEHISHLYVKRNRLFKGQLRF